MSPTRKPRLPIDIYTRVSAERGREGDSFQSPQQQEARCRAQLAADGLEAGLVFYDGNQSGGKQSRPEFDKVLERARTGQSGGIIVHDLTRFGRYATMAQDVIALEESGAMFISCAEKIDTTTSSGRFFLRVMEAMAVMYREQVGERFMVSQRDAVARGIHIAPHVPPGYTRALDDRGRPTGPLLLDPRYAPTLKKAYRMAAEGVPFVKIAAFLTEQQFPSGGRAAVWRSNRLKRLLKNRVYLGEARYGDIINPGAHEAITDPATWQLAQREPAAPTYDNRAKTLLAGLIRCDCCRHAMRASAGQKKVHTYECSSTKQRRDEKCEASGTAVSRRRVESYVLEQWLRHLLDVELRAVRDESNDEEAQEAVQRALEAEATYLALRDDADLIAALGPSEFAKTLATAKRAWDGAVTAIPAASPRVDSPYGQERWEYILSKLQAGLEPEATPEETDALIAEIVNELTHPSAELPTLAVQELRELLGRDIQAVLVRRAASRIGRLPIADRVRIVWADEEPLELPRRGGRFEREAI